MRYRKRQSIHRRCANNGTAWNGAGRCDDLNKSILIGGITHAALPESASKDMIARRGMYQTNQSGSLVFNRSSSGFHSPSNSSTGLASLRPICPSAAGLSVAFSDGHYSNNNNTNNINNNLSRNTPIEGSLATDQQTATTNHEVSSSSYARSDVSQADGPNSPNRSLRSVAGMLQECRQQPNPMWTAFSHELFPTKFVDSFIQNKISPRESNPPYHCIQLEVV